MSDGLDVDVELLIATLDDLSEDVVRLGEAIDATTERIDDVAARVRRLQKRLGTPVDPQPDWDELVRPELSRSPLITAAEREAIRRRFTGTRVSASLDRYDVLAAIAAGLVGTLIDWVVVKTPMSGMIGGERLPGSTLTETIRENALPHDNVLADLAKVGFDRVVGTGVDGMGPMTHRVQTFGHDPLLGLVLGTMDIMRGTMTAVAPTGKVFFGPGTMPPVASPGVALAIEIAHLLSDVVTSAGLPLPGWTALLAAGEVGGIDIGGEARLMYLRGYDSWHFVTMGTSVAAVELIVRGYIGFRNANDPEYRERLDREHALGGTTRTGDLATFRAMALIAHGVAACGNAGKLFTYQGNPLALNYPQWLTFVRAVAKAVDERTTQEQPARASGANRLELDTGWAKLNLRLDELESALNL